MGNGEWSIVSISLCNSVSYVPWLMYHGDGVHEGTQRIKSRKGSPWSINNETKTPALRRGSFENENTKLFYVDLNDCYV